MSKKQKDKSELFKIAESSLLGSTLAMGVTLPPTAISAGVNLSAMKKMQNSLKDSDYLYDANKIIKENPRLKGVVLSDKVPRGMKWLPRFGLPALPLGKEVPVDATGSMFAPSMLFYGGTVYTPHKGGKVSAIGLHELGHASNFASPERVTLLAQRLKRAQGAAGLGSLVSATQLGEDNPLLVGGIGGLIAGVLGHKAAKARFMEEAQASARALRYIRKTHPERIKKDAELLKTALGTYKRGLPLQTLGLAALPLTIAYTRQRLNKGEIKKDKILGKLF